MANPKIPLTEWAKTRYNPPPSLFTLRRWARESEIFPPPEKVGKSYYVDENAERVGTMPPGAMSLVDRLKAP
jgi:hypothetical protein